MDSNCGVTPAQAKAELQKVRDLFRDSVFVFSSLTLRCPEIEAKMVLGRTTYEFSRWIRKLEDRISALYDKEVVHHQYSINQPLARISYSKSTAEVVTCFLNDFDPSVIQLFDDYQALTHPRWDEPAHELLNNIRHALVKLSIRFTKLKDDLLNLFGMPFQNLSPSVVKYDSIQVSSVDRPSRDSRFSISFNPPSRPNTKDIKEKVIADMHINLMSLEIPTVEACSRNLCDFSEVPLEFIEGMGIQIYDEARHAESCYHRILELGGEIGAYAADMQIWEMATGLDLVHRLAVHQRIGESIGIDGALWSINDLVKVGDLVTANLYRYVALDEIAHVHIGNKWIRRLCKDDMQVEAVHKMAMDRRGKFSDCIDGPRPFPLNIDALALAGFNNEEIEQLKKRSP